MGAATGLLSGELLGGRSSSGGILGGTGFSLPGVGGGLHEAGQFRGYRDGGRWDKDLGRWVVTGEDGEELLVADDGTTQRLGVGGPQLVKVDKPGVVVPAKSLSHAASQSAAQSVSQNVLGRVAPRGPGGYSSMPLQPTLNRRRGIMKALDLPVMRDVNSLRRTDGAGRPVENQPEQTGGAPGGTPTGDERLTGEGGAELGARQVLPAIREEFLQRAPAQQGVASGALGGPGGAAPEATPPPAPYREGSAYRHYRELLADTEVDDRNGRLKSAARMAATGIQPTDSLGNAVGQLAGKFVSGLIRPEADEEVIDRPRDLRRAQVAAEAEAAEEKRQREWDAHVADVNLKNSTAEWNRQRPEAAQHKALQESVKYDIASRLKDPRPFDPNDESDVDLLTRARSVGFHVSPGSFGDTKNPFTLEVLDSTDPSGIRKTRLSFDRTSRTWSPVTDSAGSPVVTNRVQPVGDDGMTPTQRETNADRDRAFDATQQYRTQMLALSGDRFQLALTNGLNAQAAREFNVRTQGLQQQVNQIRTQIEGWKSKAKAYTVDPAEAERRVKELEGQAAPLLGELEKARTDALGKMSSAPGSLPTMRTAPPAAGRFAGRRMPRANLAAAAKELGYGEGPDAERRAEEHIKREGGVIY